MDWQALALTIKLATVTTAILLVIAVPLAALLVLGRSRWLAIVEALAALPLVLPPTVLGFFLLVLLGPRTFVGRGITAFLGHPLAFLSRASSSAQSYTACLSRSSRWSPVLQPSSPLLWMQRACLARVPLAWCSPCWSH